MAEGEAPEGGDRTEAPTQRRLDKAREQGQVALSREAIGFATLLAATLAGFLALPPLGMEWLRALRALLEAPGAEAAEALVPTLLRNSAMTLMPVLAAVAAAAVLASMAQTGPLLRGEALLPQWSRISPLAALKRIFGPEGLAELLRTLLKLGVVGLALHATVEPERLALALHQSAGALMVELGRGALALLAAVLLAFGALAALDVLFVRWRHFRQLRMNREELKEEARDTEGDPMIRARLRQLRETRGRQRMLAAVPKATVVITNPTHYAVALTYAEGQSTAPRLVAKGVDAMAARIRAAATEHGVPIVANPPLARALHRLDPDTEIPAEHWQAVAEIIAYVWALEGRHRAG